MFNPSPSEPRSQGPRGSLDLGIQFPRFYGTTHRFKHGDEIIGRSNLYRGLNDRRIRLSHLAAHIDVIR